MNAFEYSEKLWDIFTNDEELVTLLNVNTRDNRSYALKFRQQDMLPEEFEPEELDFIAWYFSDAYITPNDFMNLGILKIDIYTSMRDNVALIRKRIVDLIHENFDERVRGEGQYTSGIVNVYKYRLEFTPLVFT